MATSKKDASKAAKLMHSPKKDVSDLMEFLYHGE
jgi:hypothetical protein